MFKKCKYCNLEIEIETPKQFGAHVGNCNLNPNRKPQVKHPIIKYDLKCLKCDKEYSVNISENNFNKGRYTKYCCRGCANSRVVSDEHKKKTSSSVLSYQTSDKQFCYIYHLNCKNCTKLFIYRNKDMAFCCKSCSLEYKEKIVTKKLSCQIYYNTCKCCNKVFIYKNNKQYCSKECKSSLLSTWAKKGGLKSVQSQSITRRSKNEIYFAELCSKYFKIETNQPIFNGWDADIIIPELKIAILWNGKWHYEKITKKHSVEQVQNRDRIKQDEIIKAGYTPYIIKDMGKYNREFVELEFQKFINLPHF